MKKTVSIIFIMILLCMYVACDAEKPVEQFGLTVSEQLELAHRSAKDNAYESETTEAETTEAEMTEAETTEAETTEAGTTEAETTEIETTESVTEKETAAVTSKVETERLTAEETTAEATSNSYSLVTYVLNTNSEKFHEPGCSSVKKMKDENRSDFTGTREEAIAMGYDPCGNCKP
ncbi:MAG: hypothetical protein IJ391_05080 [Clostridia bacterium]|nr:hypothetical protein [Clostridia bacterium]